MKDRTKLIQLSKENYEDLFYKESPVKYEDLEVLFEEYDCEHCSSLFAVFRRNGQLRFVNERRKDWDSFQQINMLECSKPFKVTDWVTAAIQSDISDGIGYPPAIHYNIVLFVYSYCAKLSLPQKNEAKMGAFG